MATQTLSLRPFKTMAITVTGELRPGVTAKDLIGLIAQIGTGGGQNIISTAERPSRSSRWRPG